MIKTVIKKVETKKDLKLFIRFNYEMYKDNIYAVPDLYSDMKNTLDAKKNPALEYCETEYFLAYQNNKIVGRIAAIINHRANQTWNKKTVRFGYIDFIDDENVSKALIDTVIKWGQSKGMEIIEGPLGFTDLDKEGMLIEGYDQLGTMATIYNYPYYPIHMVNMGFEKAIDWIEMKLIVPKQVPEKYLRIADIVRKKYNLTTYKIKNYAEVKKTGIGYKIFELINEAYSPLFGYCQMTNKQISQYIKEYMPMLDLDLVSVIKNANDEIVAVGISMPSMSKALQKAKGKLFPFGWWYLLKSLRNKKTEIIDLLLVAVKPEYQGKGVNALLFADLLPRYINKKTIWCETNPELEINDKVQSQWQYFENTIHKRRRCFTKKI